MVQDPPQDGNAASTTPDKRYTALLNDSIFKGIHNAYLMGASIVELKARIEVAVCDSLLGAVTFDSSTSTFSPVFYGSSTTKQQPNAIDDLLNKIVLKDLAPKLSAELRDHAWLTSVLRAIYKQIVMLHIDRFPNSTTTNTVYDLPNPPQNEQDLSSYPYPYLYPGILDPDGKMADFDYANVGIGRIQDDASSGYIKQNFFDNFKLYDVTRRALNCLTLLLDEAEESLLPVMTGCYQRRLVQAILADSQIPSKEPDCRKIPELGPDKIKTTVEVLGDLVVRLLEAWDSFLRECFYSDMGSKSNDPNALKRDDEIELAAYEAGRSLTALSWNVSMATAPLEKALKSEQENDPKIKDYLTRKAQTTWLQAFNDRDINQIQYQINALCTALDQAYYRVHPDIKPPGADDPLTPLNPDLPSQAIQAVKHSLNYWQRTVTWICSSNETNQPALKPALDPSSVGKTIKPAIDSALAVKTNQPAIDSAPTAAQTQKDATTGISSPSQTMKWQLSKSLRTELIQQAIVWQSLILCQQSLKSFTMEKVTQRILDEFMQDLEKAIIDEIKNNKVLRNLSIGIIAVIFVIIVLLIVAAATNYHSFSFSDLIKSPLVIITAIGALITPFATGISSRLSKLGTFFGVAGTATEQGLQRGYARLLIEFGYLNHNLAITFPLIEFFLWEGLQAVEENPNGAEPIKTAIEDGYDFLVKVFWSRTDFEEEFQRVAQAAFGPISAFIHAQLQVTPPTAKNSKPR
jgi:hypothetical protein